MKLTKEFQQDKKGAIKIAPSLFYQKENESINMSIIFQIFDIEFLLLQ